MTARLVTALIAGVAAALLVAGCGNNKKPQIPRTDARQLIALLESAKRQASAQPPECDSLTSTIAELKARAQALPSNMDSNVRDSVSNGIDNLDGLARQQCAQTQTTNTQTTTTESVPTQTTAPTTPTNTTPTTPTNTTPTNSTPTTPNGGGGTPAPNGNGNGNGNGDGKKGKKEKGPKGD